MKIVTVFNGIKNDYPKREINLPKGSTINFCCVGAICYHKNQFDILKAFNFVKNKTTNFKLYLIGGGDDDYISMLKEYAIKNGLSDNIIFLGYQDNVNDILQNMHIGIMASKCEAFGRVTVEYMNASMLVIAANTGGSPEIVRNNISGFIFKQGDYEALAKIIEHIIASPNIITTLGCNGYDIAHKDFSIENNIDCIYTVIKNMQNNE